MAHAAPTAGRRGTGRPATGPDGLPDVFSARTHRVASVAVPVVLGLVYGYWAAANRRAGGEITGWNLLFGWVTALAFMVLHVAVRAVARHLKRGLHALVWAAFAGCAFGFLFGQSGNSVLESTLLSLIVGAGFFVALFYRYYTHEDARGRRVV